MDSARDGTGSSRTSFTQSLQLVEAELRESHFKLGQDVAVLELFFFILEMRIFLSFANHDLQSVGSCFVLSFCEKDFLAYVQDCLQPCPTN